MEYEIRGLRVRFPFKAYECQLIFMERVIQALQEGTNALLESPTGTGKTLCLLCATLAWREAEQSRIAQTEEGSNTHAPRIFYLSRTHSQLTKVISELRNTSYAPTTALLGARSQMCVNPAVRALKGARLNTACHGLVARRACNYYEGVAAKKEDPAIVRAILDIEELPRLLESHKCCPYYLSRELQLSADIVFLPYNYVLEPSARRTSKVELHGAVLIFDEAHNLDSFCEDATSCTLTSIDLRDALRDITPLLPRLSRLPQETADHGRVATDFQSPASPTDERPIDISAPDFADACSALANVLRGIESAMDRAPLGVASNGRALYTMFANAGLKFTNAARHISCLDALATLLQDPQPDERQGAAARAPAAPQAPRAGAAAVGRISEALKTIFVENLDEASALARADYFRMHVHLPNNTTMRPGMSNDNKDRELAFWCMSAGVAMQELRRLGVRNILLASGTLSPLAHTAYEFQTEFPVRLENPHIVAPQQLWVGAMARGVTNIALNSSYRNRDSVAYKRELGSTLVNFCRMVPAGLLVFFPSYTLLTACVAFWKSPESSSSGGATAATTVWDRVCKYKHAVVEPRENAQFAAALAEYRNRVTDPSRQGAVFFAVCRGKVAEGLDFADDMGRGVLVTGLPYPALGDDKVKVKRAYLDERAAALGPAGTVAGEKPVSGNEWYSAQAWKAVNQAVGRVIRHRWDYAAIVLLDERFCAEEKSFLSRWLQPYLRVHGQFAETSLSLARFFKEGPGRVAEAKAKDSQQQTSTDVPAAAAPSAPALTHAPPILRGAGAPPPAAAGAAAPKAPLTDAERRAADLKATVDAFKRQAKAALPAAEYGVFQQALVRYRRREIVATDLMEELEPAFRAAGPDSYVALMRGFIQFLPPQERARYAATLPEEPSAPPAGDGGVAPAPWMPSRAPKREEEGGGGKRRTVDLITGEASTVSNKAPRLERAASLELRTPPPAALPPPPVAATRTIVTSPTAPPPQSHVFATPPPRPPRSPAAGASSISKFPPLLPQTPPPPPLELHHHTASPAAASPVSLPPAPVILSSPAPHAPSVAPPHLESPPKDGVGADVADKHSPEKEAPRAMGKCAVCLDPPQDPCAARCGHVLCQPCWDKQLSTKLECPVCKQKVRKSQVKRIYLG